MSEVDSSFNFLRTSIDSISEMKGSGWNKTLSIKGTIIDEPSRISRLTSLAWSVWDRPVGQLTEKSFRMFNSQLQEELSSLEKERIKLMQRAVKDALVSRDEVKLAHVMGEVDNCEESLLIGLQSKTVAKNLSSLKQKLNRARTNQERSRLASQIMQQQMSGSDRIKRCRREFDQVQGRLKARRLLTLQDGAKSQILAYDKLIEHTDEQTFESIPTVSVEQFFSYEPNGTSIKQRLSNLCEIQDVAVTIANNLANDEHWIKEACHNRDFEILQSRMKRVTERLKVEIQQLEVTFITQFAEKRLNQITSSRPDRQRSSELRDKQRNILNGISQDLKAIENNSSSLPETIKNLQKQVSDEYAVIDFNEKCGRQLGALRSDEQTKEQLHQNIKEAEVFLNEEIPEELLKAKNSNVLFLHRTIGETLSFAKRQLADLWEERFFTIEKALKSASSQKEVQQLMRVCRQEIHNLHSNPWDEFFDSTIATSQKTLQKLAESLLPFFLPRFNSYKASLKSPPQTIEELLELQKGIETLSHDMQACRKDLAHAKRRGFLRSFNLEKTLDDMERMRQKARNLVLTYDCKEKFTSIQKILSDPNWASQLKDHHYVQNLVQEIKWLKKTLDEKVEPFEDISYMAQKTEELLSQAQSLLTPKLKPEEVIMLTTIIAQLKGLKGTRWWKTSLSMPFYSKNAPSLPPPKHLPPKRAARYQQPSRKQ